MIRPYKEHIPAIHESAFLAENATVIGRVSLAADTTIWYGAVLRGDECSITIGYGSNVQDNASVHGYSPKNCDVVLGEYVTVGHNAVVHGCKVGDRTLIGMGATVLNGAVIGHVGHNNTRVFREVKQLGEELERLGTSILGAANKADVGIIFDWDNYWALEYTSGPTEDLTYVNQIHQYYKYFYVKNIGVNMIPVDADFSKYKIVVAPVLYMVKKGMKEALTEFVKNGGILITTFMSGIVNESDNVYLGGYPGPLRELAGVWVEEIDALAPEQTNKITFADGTSSTCSLLCDLIHLEGAQSVACYESNFYAGMPAITKNQYGKGYTYYIGTNPTEDGIVKVLDMAVQTAGVTSVVSGQPALRSPAEKLTDSPTTLSSISRIRYCRCLRTLSAKRICSREKSSLRAAT